jgi:formate hydrogenlyase subunit 3/multisubunit Na+/H+ antiporter MnhD subunit
MRKVYILLIFGVWIVILPYLGFPYFWKNILITFSGLEIIYISFMLYKEFNLKQNKKETFDNFSENNFEEKKEINS